MHLVFTASVSTLMQHARLPVHQFISNLLVCSGSATNKDVFEAREILMAINSTDEGW
jgi:hypothetical protein